MEMSTALATPKIITVGGRDYTFSPLTAADIGTLQEFLRSKPISAVVTALASAEEMGMDLSKELRQSMMDAAFRESLRINLIGARTPEALETTNTLLSAPDSTITLWWLSLRANHTRITRKLAASVIQDYEGDPVDITLWIWESSGMTIKKRGDEADPTKTEETPIETT